MEREQRKHQELDNEVRANLPSSMWSKLLTLGNWVFSIMVLSFLWCVSMALVIPAGAACAALCEACRRLLIDDDTALLKRFFVDLWRYRWRGTAVFWTGAAICLFILLDLRIVRAMPVPFSPIVQILLWWLLLLSAVFFCNAFPLLAQHSGTIRAFYRRLAVFTFATLPRSVIGLLISAALVFVGLSSALFAILFCGGLLGLWNTWNSASMLRRLERKVAALGREP